MKVDVFCDSAMMFLITGYRATISAPHMVSTKLSENLRIGLQIVELNNSFIYIHDSLNVFLWAWFNSMLTL